MILDMTPKLTYILRARLRYRRTVTVNLRMIVAAQNNYLNGQRAQQY